MEVWSSNDSDEPWWLAVCPLDRFAGRDKKLAPPWRDPVSEPSAQTKYFNRRLASDYGFMIPLN